MYFIEQRKLKEATTPGIPFWSIYRRLCEQQNLLIAGTTGSGKSTVLQGMIHAIINRYTAVDAELWLADPKQVDLMPWLDAHTPHVTHYADSPEEICEMIEDLFAIMQSRFSWMKANRKNLYPGKAIYLIVDEMGDLLTSCPHIQKTLVRLVQLCRAARIHVVLCCQNPSRKTIPTTIQCCMTSTLALRCRSAIESRAVIGTAGAEQLPKYGIGIFSNPDTGLEKVELPLQDQEETNRAVQFSVEHAIYR